MWLKKRTFSGGVHPPDEKKWTSQLAIEAAPIPETVIIPLQQHIGKPSKPIVAVGDTVKTGDPLSAADGFVSLPVHASISGTVKKIELRPHPLGTKALSVVIESDGENAWNPEILTEPDEAELDKAIILQRISAAGIAGAGGATFPTHVKLSPPPSKTIDTFIVNGVECEPYLTADHRLMLEAGQKLLKGMKLVQQVLGCDKCYIGIEKNKPDAIRHLRDLIKKNNLNYEVVALALKYPQGAEKQLIYAATGRKVPRGGLPMDCGCVVQNVGTVVQIYDAVYLKKPVIERVVTVTGRGVNSQKNLMVRLGTPMQNLIDFCDGLTEDAGKVLNGGPMMGIAQYTLEVPVIKGTSGVLVLTEKEASLSEESPCIRCGRCVEVCPMNLMPNFLGSLVEYDKLDQTRKAGIMDCIEC
ncbi:electron transport complex subunit RsxC, partial [bacterium]|nr:electron transport complex subunit RsxC [bacterium]